MLTQLEETPPRTSGNAGAAKEGEAAILPSCDVLGAKGAISYIMVRSLVYHRTYEENLR